jgi:hypothetical protein
MASSKYLTITAIAAVLAITPFLTAKHASATPCAFTDVSLTIGGTTYLPTTCADGVTQGSGATVETNALNAALGTTGFVYLDRSGVGGKPHGLGGVAFTVTAPSVNSGTWTVSWSDVVGLPNLPLVLNLEVALFGGGNGAGYLLEDVVLTVSPNFGTGSFDINFTKPNGQQPVLAHLLLAGGDPRTPTNVPEPSALGVLGASVFGLGILRRRRAQGYDAIPHRL